MHHEGKAIVAVACAGTLVCIGVWVTRLLTLRQGASLTHATGLDAFIELTRRRLSDDLKWYTFRRHLLNVIAPLLVPWLVWAFVHRYELYRAEPWLAAGEFGALLAFVAALFVHLRRKARALEAARERFEALVDDRTIC